MPGRKRAPQSLSCQPHAVALPRHQRRGRGMPVAMGEVQHAEADPQRRPVRRDIAQPRASAAPRACRTRPPARPPARQDLDASRPSGGVVEHAARGRRPRAGRPAASPRHARAIHSPACRPTASGERDLARGAAARPPPAAPASVRNSRCGTTLRRRPGRLADPAAGQRSRDGSAGAMSSSSRRAASARP